MQELLTYQGNGNWERPKPEEEPKVPAGFQPGIWSMELNHIKHN